MPAGMGFMLTGMGKGRVGIYRPIPVPARPLPVNPTGYPYPCQTLQPMLNQQCVALQQHCEANNTSTSDDVSSDDGPPRGQVTHQSNPKPCLEVADSIDGDDNDDESDSSDDDSDILKEFVPKITGQKRREEVATETPEREHGESCSKVHTFQHVS
jgi:hypothetical protein